jgi:hypothetical protein
MIHIRAAGLHALAAFVSAVGVAQGQLKINEVYYHVNGPQEANQFVELFNAGSSTAYLDGLILTDEAGTGIEGIFQFPGAGAEHPVPPGGFVVIAVDGDGSDGVWPDLSTADWECYAGPGDFDNPSVSNLTLVGGSHDLSLYTGGDNVLLASGADVVAPIASATIIDGMNFNYGGGELTDLPSSAVDADPRVTAAQGLSLARCSDGLDSDVSSTADFSQNVPTPGAANSCGVAVPSISIADTSVIEGRAGTSTAQFAITLSFASLQTVTVWYCTADGTAAAGNDYIGVSTTLLTFAVGVTSQSVGVAVLGDTNREPDEVFYVNLSNPGNAGLADAQGFCQILDDEHFFFRIAGGRGAVTSAWYSASGAVYRLEFSTNAINPVWNPVGSDITATGSTASAADAAAGLPTQRVYRVLRLH